MAKGISIEVRGFEQIKKKLGEIPKKVVEETDIIMTATANEVVNRAVEDAPVDMGVLKNAITQKKEGELKHVVSSGADWSAFIEFGTKSRAQIPSDLASFAAQFKGKGRGGGQGFFQQILSWVKRKKITGTYSVKTRRRLGNKADRQKEDEQVAFLIYRSILKNGIHPHPYFFKQLPQARADFQKRIDGMVKKIVGE